MAISDTINALPAYQRWVIFVLVSILYIAAWVWMVFLPKQELLRAYNQEIEALSKQVQTNQVKADRLPALLAEKEVADQQLATLQRELPVEAEAVALLKQIAELGVKGGLDFKLWRPAASRPGTGGLYVEYPVNVEVAGGYHALAGFFDQIGHLQRIVNVADLKMGSPKVGQTELVIQTSFVATAFASNPPAPPPPAPPS